MEWIWMKTLGNMPYMIERDQRSGVSSIILFIVAMQCIECDVSVLICILNG